MYLYSTLNPIELRNFPYKKMAQESLKKINYLKQYLHSAIITDKTTKETPNKTFLWRLFAIIFLFYIIEKIVKLLNNKR
jgi:hypothetical protein